jgi:hypothetical protein
MEGRSRDVTTSIKQPKAASYPKKLERQHQEPPGRESALHPKADHGEEIYRGSGKLMGRVALITGADSGIGKAVAIAFAREGADIAIVYLEEQDDAEDTACWVSKAERRSLLYPGDLAEESVCQELVRKTVAEFGRLDILVCNAAFQMSREKSGGHQQRGMGQNFQDEHLFHLLPDQDSRPAHVGRRCDHRHLFRKPRCSEADIAAVRRDQSRDSELHG